MSNSSSKNFPYLHGFSEEEQNRLFKQSEFGEFTVYRDIDFSQTQHLLEVGCGVGGQSNILLRRFPHLKLTGIDFSEKQLEVAKKNLAQRHHDQNRFELLHMDAQNMDFESNSFEGAFLCWVLEHVPDPARVLSEVRRVLKPGSPVYITEVMNSTFFLDPYSPNMWTYWMAFNDYQYNHAGDPFIGGKLGNLLSSVNFREVSTQVVTWHYDNRHPEKRKDMIEYWTDLLMSASQQLVESEYVTQKVVDLAKKELMQVQRDPNAVFMYSFVQAHAKVF